MKKKDSILSKIFTPVRVSQVVTPASLIEETNRVFKKYEKTFRDLARYDRGEKVGSR